jgi:hypothetical protein
MDQAIFLFLKFHIDGFESCFWKEAFYSYFDTDASSFCRDWYGERFHVIDYFEIQFKAMVFILAKRCLHVACFLLTD